VRKISFKLFAVAYFALFIVLLGEVHVSAYIDPATTAMLTQIIAGVFITLGVTFGIFRRKILMFFKNQSLKRTQRKIEKENKKKTT
jgi:uncharacterized protein YacL